jgi:hypothetical protein
MQSAHDLVCGTKTLNNHICIHLTVVGHYSPDLFSVIQSLCQRIGEADVGAPMEFLRLLQGLHYGGALSAGHMARLDVELSALVPHWRSQ